MIKQIRLFILSYAAIPTALAVAAEPAVAAWATQDLDPASAHFQRSHYSPFIVPNEFDNYLQYESIQQNSPTAQNENQVVIAVGTVRAFNLAAALQRPYLIAIDYDPRITRFNEDLANAILNLDYSDFLRLILGVKIGDFQDRIRFQRAAAKQLKEGVLLPRSRTQYKREFYAHFNHAKAPETLWWSWIKAMATVSSSDTRWESQFFSSPNKYEYVREMIRRRRLYIVLGNLSGPKSVKAIAAFLQAQKLVVSELDISNALEHMIYEGSSNMIRFINNTKLLPLAPNFTVLITSNDKRGEPGLHPKLEYTSFDGWVYLLRDLDEVAELQYVNTKQSLSKELFRKTTAQCQELIK